jgi:hypothetical protein
MRFSGINPKPGQLTFQLFGLGGKSSADFVAQLQRAQTDILAGIRFGHGKFSVKARVSNDK